ncbi:MAG: 3-deoxy-manno-octulosonate cytidylyltransferase, partial [Verrucomicrobiae bacterium]|nr:3-deoxy-manno-octulosonate cytidylyltransferase [Verrucomicrobiae bacterium]
HAHGVACVLTRTDHASGSDRLAEACEKLGLAGDDIVVNVQGDEPLIDPALVRETAALVAARRDCVMSTAAHVLTDADDLRNPNVVKVVLDRSGCALYFSRAPIPSFRDAAPSSALRRRCFRHIGIYAFRREFLLRYVRWPKSFLEKAEKLEQLRALENGVRIRVLISKDRPVGVDVPGDVRRVERRLRQKRRAFQGA